jgi:hypothetical protein
MMSQRPRLLVAGLLFFAGFACTASLIRLVVGDPLALYAQYRSEKMAVLDIEGRGSCSAAFGSSHVHNGFDPRAFDGTMQADGLITRSLNLAVEGGSQGEQFLLARRFLRDPVRFSRQPGPCLVMLEANAGPNMQAHNFVHPRAIDTYNDEVTALTMQFVSPELPVDRIVGRLTFAALGAAMYHAGTGMLAGWMFPHPIDAELVRRQIDDDRRGLLVEPPSAADSEAVVRAFSSRPKAPRERQHSLTPGHAALISHLMQMDEARRVQFVYLVTPNLSDLVESAVYPPCIEVDGRPVPIINVARPGSFPALYQPELWHDPAHLNEPGARELSRLVADQIARVPAVDRPPLDCTRP